MWSFKAEILKGNYYNPPIIIANNDYLKVEAGYIDSISVLSNDTIGGQPCTQDNITLTQISSTDKNLNIYFGKTDAVGSYYGEKWGNVVAGYYDHIETIESLFVGTYNLTYRITDKEDPTNYKDAQVKVDVVDTSKIYCFKYRKPIFDINNISLPTNLVDYGRGTYEYKELSYKDGYQWGYNDAMSYLEYGENNESKDIALNIFMNNGYVDGYNKGTDDREGYVTYYTDPNKKDFKTLVVKLTDGQKTITYYGIRDWRNVDDCVTPPPIHHPPIYL